jgi:glycosyltransferase involved in cell wall biosynthesis
VASTERFRLRRVGLGGWLPRRLVYGRAAEPVGRVESPLLDRQIGRMRPTVLHIVDQPPPRLRTHPRIVTLHDLGPSDGGAEAVEPSSPGATARSGLASVLTADVTFCVSEATRRDAIRMLGIAPECVEVLHPGVDTRCFSPGVVDGIRGELGLPECARYFLHVGVLHKRKNPQGLLDAFRVLAASFHDLHLVCVGPYQTSLEASRRVHTLAVQLGVEARLHLVGDLSDATLVRAYRGSLGLVFPSLHEGFGFPVVEALACGVPVVAGDNSSLPEVGGDLAVLVDAKDHRAIADGMKRVLDDDRLRTRAQVAGPTWAKQFSWRAVAARVHDVHAELTARTGRR